MRRKLCVVPWRDERVTTDSKATGSRSAYHVDNAIDVPRSRLVMNLWYGETNNMRFVNMDEIAKFGRLVLLNLLLI